MKRVFLECRIEPSLLPVAVLGGIALALFSFRPIPASHPAVELSSPEQKLLQQSERLIRKVAGSEASLVYSSHSGERSRRKGVSILQVDCATEDGVHLVSLLWNHDTGELASLSRQIPSDRDAPEPPLPPAQASARAVGWLRRLELIAEAEGADIVAQRETAEGGWNVQVVSSHRRFRVMIQRRTGELMWLVSHVRSEER